MPQSYSRDLRERVIEAVEAGASRREASERFEVSAASAVKWLQRWHETRSAVPKRRGGSISPLEQVAAEVLALVDEQPDLTLVEMVEELRKQRIWRARRRWMREQGLFDPARLVFIDETAVSTNLVRPRGRALRGERDRQRSPWDLANNHFCGGVALQ